MPYREAERTLGKVELPSEFPEMGSKRFDFWEKLGYNVIVLFNLKRGRIARIFSVGAKVASREISAGYTERKSNQ